MVYINRCIFYIKGDFQLEIIFIQKNFIPVKKQFEYEDIIEEVEKKFNEFLTHDLPEIEAVLLDKEINDNKK